MQALSPTDSAFLWMETRSQPMHVAGLNIYTPPAQEEQHLHRFLAGWRKHLSAHAPFNLRPVLKMGLWYWEEDQDFELDYHLRHVALPQPGRIRELLAHLFLAHASASRIFTCSSALGMRWCQMPWPSSKGTPFPFIVFATIEVGIPLLLKDTLSKAVLRSPLLCPSMTIVFQPNALHLAGRSSYGRSCMPDWFQSIIRRYGLERESISKYALAVITASRMGHLAYS